MIKKTFLLILTLLFSLTLSGCIELEFDPMNHFNYYDEGDFVFATYKREESDPKLYLYGLTEEGKQKEYLILPQEYKGKKVDCFTIELSTFNGGRYYRHDFESSVLKRVYINFELVDIYDYDFSIDKVSNQYSFVIWYDFSNRVLYNFNLILENRVYGNNLFSNEETREEMAKVYYYNSTIISYIGNVSYQYNYEEAPNDGYYWVDNYDNALIEYIPPEPTREGYIFGGWYKEAECINKWDFEKDRTGDLYEYYPKPGESSAEEYKEFYEDYISTHTYVETKLYAKWIEN